MSIYWEEGEKLKELFVGKSVKKVDDEHLLLSDGTKVKLVGISDCCAYYDLMELNDCENVITNVVVSTDVGFGSDGYTASGTYNLFVFADNQKINLATFEGTDGNGYYGTGFWIEVEK